MLDQKTRQLRSAAGLLLRLLRINSGLEQERMAARLSTSQPTISRWEKGRGAPSEKELTDWLMLCQVAMRSQQDIVDGQRERTARLSENLLNRAMKTLFAVYAPDEAAQELTAKELLVDLRRLAQILLLGEATAEDAEGSTLIERAPLSAPSLVPLYADIAAGLGEEQEARETPRETIEVPRHVLRSDAGAYALRVRGDSMAPLLLEGDVVVVSPAALPEEGALVAAYVEPDGDVVKRFSWADKAARLAYDEQLRRSESGEGPQLSYITPEALLKPENDAYPVIRIGGELGRPARIWGRVVLQLREL
jgi:SOS-response transcriptional repressor LexA